MPLFESPDSSIDKACVFFRAALRFIMINNLNAKYTKLPSGGYMGQLIEWPEVITEGLDLEDCRASLKDAVEQMVLAYNEQNKEIPIENA